MASFVAICLVAVMAFFVAYILQNDDVTFTYFEFAPAIEVEQNNHLAKAEKLLENKIQGPEGLAFNKGKMYTGIDDGRLIEIDVDNPTSFRNVTTIGARQCGHVGPISKDCGRILGLYYDSRYGLLVADAYLGLYAVNVTTGEQKHLWDGHKPIEGRECKFWNDVTVVPRIDTRDKTNQQNYKENSGRIFATESSWKWTVRQFANMLWDIGTTTRIFEYHPKTGEMTSVCNTLINGNGLVTHWDGDSVLVGETVAARVSRCYISGPKKGKAEVFIEGLPGYVDNIRRSQTRGEYWLALTAVRTQGSGSTYIEYLGMYPLARKFVFALIKMWRMLPIKRKKPFKKLGMILSVNSRGRVSRVIGCDNGRIAGVSHVEAVQYKGTQALYLGSVQRAYVARLPL